MVNQQRTTLLKRYTVHTEHIFCTISNHNLLFILSQPVKMLFAQKSSLPTCPACHVPTQILWVNQSRNQALVSDLISTSSLFPSYFYSYLTSFAWCFPAQSRSSTPSTLASDPATCPIIPGCETTIDICKGRTGLGLSIVGGCDTLLVGTEKRIM